MKDELNAYGRTIGEEIETKYIRSDELEIRNTNTLQEDIRSSKLYEYVEDFSDKPKLSKFLKLIAYMALNMVISICLIVFIACGSYSISSFFVFENGCLFSRKNIKCEYSKYRYSIFFIEYYRLFNVYSFRWF